MPTATAESESIRTAILADIQGFLTSLLRDDEITIGLLRYGAHIPLIYQRTPEAYGVRPLRLLLSHMLDFFPRDYYANKRFLVLDDSVYKGTSMSDALKRLSLLGVQRENIRTAAIVVHSHCEKSELVDERRHVLDDTTYIEWKEELTAIVRSDVRPTERDHPLYYFSSRLSSAGPLLDAVRNLGIIQSVDAPSPNVFKFTLSIGDDVLADLRSDCISLPAPPKVRFYCDSRRTSEPWVITTVPIAPTVINVDRFLGAPAERMERMLTLPKDFFAAVKYSAGDHWRDVIYYYANRGIAALLLERILCQVSAALAEEGTSLESLDPTLVDGVVHYEFPVEYRDVFHPIMFQRLDRAVRCGGSNCSHAREFARPLRNHASYSGADIRFASRLLVPIVHNTPPVVWRANGAEWEPASHGRHGTPYEELFKVVSDPPFVSSALDTLLDDGLLRAIDAPLIAGSAEYGRLFMPGGEYRALEVERRALSITAEPKGFSDSDNTDEETQGIA